MTEEKLPKVDIHIRLKKTGERETDRKKAEKIKSELEKMADDFELEVSVELFPDKKTYYAGIGGATSKQTLEKIFGAKLRYEVDPDYRSDVKIWILDETPKVPEQFKEEVESIELDYW